MPQTIDRHHGVPLSAAPDPGAHRAGAVMLVTVGGAPFAPGAATLALDAAVESGARLVVVDLLSLAPGGRRPRLDAIAPPPAVAAPLRAPAELARSLGLPAELLHVHSPRPVAALRQIVAERRPALVVFGPDPARLSRVRGATPRRCRRLVRALERHAPCLLWSGQGPAAGAVPAPRPSSRAASAPLRPASARSETTMAGPASSHAPPENGARS
ncbi:MAG: hypothetical protein QOC64_386 [Solirubrobacteraceae bacterium]|jgi:hypothetical protein|nr:hypothetical protein [Solirubrobacteraceae bacterium]